MSGRHPAGMRPRDETAHPVVKHAIEQGYLGTGQPYIVKGFADWEAADRGRRSINNACRHLGVSCSSRAAEHIIQAPDGTFEVHFRLYPKSTGRQYVRQQTGGDPAKLAYNPFQRGERAIVDDSGRSQAV
jgi:hypothetical protein